LITQGGFPEPFLTDDPVESDRWRMQYLNGLIRTDVLDFERIHDFKAMELVLELLISTVDTASPAFSLYSILNMKEKREILKSEKALII